MGDTWVCVATGPSLTQEDVDYAAARARMAMANNAWELCPEADLMLASDARWWQHHGAKVLRKFKGRTYTISGVASRKYGCQRLRMPKGVGWSAQPDTVASGELTGYRLINLVGHEKPERILLLGYDMQHTGGQTHYFGDHPNNWPNCPDLERQRKYFQTLADESPVPIINCTRDTALTCFPRADLREVL